MTAVQPDAGASTDAERFEQLVFDLTSGFAGVSAEQIDECIDQALKQLLEFTRVDQCGFFTVFPETGEGQLSYLASLKVTMPVGTTVPWARLLPWIYPEVIRNEAFFFSHLDELPCEAAADRTYLEARGIRSALFIPYAVDGAVRYLFAIVANRSERDWPKHVVDRLNALGTVFISALNRKSLIAAKSQAQDRLASAQRFARAQLDALNECVGVVDATGILVEASAGWRALGEANGGCAEGAPVGANFVTACESIEGPHREAAVELATAIRRALGGGGDTFETDFARLHQGELRWTRSRVRRFVVNDSVYAAISHEDITGRRKSDEELQELRDRQWHAQRIAQTGVLIASIAHELSQPLAAILSNAQAGMRFIARDALDPQEIREILSDIVADDKRATEIMESLRNMLRRQKPSREPVDVAAVVHDVVRMLHSEFIRQQVVVERACQSGCLVLANSARLQQVALNLMMNGIEAMGELPAARRRLRVEVRRMDGDKIRLAVRDSGSGIEPEALKRVFDAFFTTKSTGTGMGLAVCQSIIESYGGRIWIESDRDAGCTFFVELQAIPAQTAGKSEAGYDDATIEPAAGPL